MLKRGNWSVEELDKLRQQYGRRSLPQLARELRRTHEAVMQRAKLSFRRKLKPEKLSRADEATLRTMIGVADIEIMELVLSRSPAEILKVLEAWAVVSRKGASRKGASRKGSFQPWEISYLKNYYASRPDWAICLVLRRDLASVHERAREMCLGKDRSLESVPLPQLEKLITIPALPPIKMPRWTAGDVVSLRRLYSSRSNLELARTLGRSEKSVVAKANELRLRKSSARLRKMGRENVEIRHRSARGQSKLSS